MDVFLTLAAIYQSKVENGQVRHKFWEDFYMRRFAASKDATEMWKDWLVYAHTIQPAPWDK